MLFILTIIEVLKILGLHRLCSLFVFQGLDEEAIVDYGKTSFTTQTNYEKEDLESKLIAKISLVCFFFYLKKLEFQLHCHCKKLNLYC